jgi:hypothetical protein
MVKAVALNYARVTFNDDDALARVIPLKKRSVGETVFYYTGEDYELKFPSQKSIIFDVEARVEGKQPVVVSVAMTEAGAITFGLKCVAPCAMRLQTRHGEFFYFEYGEPFGSSHRPRAMA